MSTLTARSTRRYGRTDRGFAGLRLINQGLEQRRVAAVSDRSAISKTTNNSRPRPKRHTGLRRRSNSTRRTALETEPGNLSRAPFRAGTVGTTTYSATRAAFLKTVEATTTRGSPHQTHVVTKASSRRRANQGGRRARQQKRSRASQDRASHPERLSLIGKNPRRAARAAGLQYAFAKGAGLFSRRRTII